MGFYFWRTASLVGKWGLMLGLIQLSSLADKSWSTFSKQVTKDTYGELDWDPATELDEEGQDESGRMRGIVVVVVTIRSKIREKDLN